MVVLRCGIMKLESDRERWDRKYAAGEGPAHFRPQPFLTGHRRMFRGNRALDVACGFGGNAMYLASLGYHVDAIDVSKVALVRAQGEMERRGLILNLVQADLSRWWVPPARYDLIIAFYYLNRDMMPQVASGLRPGGLLFQANRNTCFLKVRPNFDPDYLLQPGELRHLTRAAGLEVILYREGIASQNYDSQIIARRPA